MSAKRAVVVAMSGGLDSSVTAMLMKQRGHHVIGVFMSNWDRADEAGSENEICPNDQDYEDAREVCDRLGIRELLKVSFQKEYWNDVFTPYVEDYANGLLTPNPDVDCNRHVKFNYLRHYVNAHIGEHTIATGHYARVAVLPRLGVRAPAPPPDPLLWWRDEALTRHYRAALLTASDGHKDQSYFLSTVREQHLRQFVFPLGHLRKTEVRQLAAAENSPLRGANILAKKESMGVCFIGKRSLPEFLGNYLKPTPGRYIDISSGEVLGPHQGVEFLTCGQRARISGVSERYFICKKVPRVSSDPNLCFGDVLVGQGPLHPGLYSDYLLVDKNDMKFISAEALARICLDRLDESGVFYYCKARSYEAALRACTIELVSLDGEKHAETVSVKSVLSALRDGVQKGSGCSSNNGLDSNQSSFEPLPFTHFRVKYTDGPERAITAGQVCVLYREVASNLHSDRSALFLPMSVPASSFVNTNEGKVVRSEAQNPPMLECIGGGRIYSPGPTYLDEGKVVPPAPLRNNDDRSS